MLGVSQQEYQDLILSVGTHRGRRRLSPLEVARLLDRALTEGETRRRCAAALGISTSQVSTFLKLRALVPEIQHLADWRGSKSASIPFSTLAELARLSLVDQVEVAEAVLRHDLTWKEVVQLVQIANRSGKATEECIADILNLRPEIETRHLFIGAVSSQNLAYKLQSLSQGDRDHLMASVLMQITSPGYSAKGRLGSKEFLILSQHNLPNLLNLTADEIEQKVNELLAWPGHSI